MLATFRSLRHPNFRALWLGLALSASGSWLQLVGQGLLVLRLSGGSALALGATSLAQGLAFFIFVLAGGVLADRLEPRRILFVTQGAALVFALVLSLLTVSGLVRVWSVVLLAFFSSAVSSFDQPARAALLPRLVPTEDLANAVGTTASAILQLNVADALRARVMSLNSLVVMGARPLGDFGLALLVSAFSVAPVILGGAAIVGLQTVFLTLRRRVITGMERS